MKKIINIENQSGVNKLGVNLLIFTIGSFASKLMNYFLLPFYTSVLTQTEYGVYDIVITTGNLLFPLFTLLITEATMRFALDRDIDNKKIFTISAIVVGVGCIIYLIMSPLLLLSEVFRHYYLYFVFYQILHTINTLIAQYVKGKGSSLDFAVSGVIATAVTITLNIILMVVWKYGLTGYFISSFAGTAVSIIYLFFKCRLYRDFCRITVTDKPLIKEMLKYSIPIMPNSISWWISTSSDKYMISYVCGNAANGLYSAAYKIPSLMTVFTNIFFTAWNISVVEDFGSENSKKMIVKIHNCFFSVVLILSSFIVCFTKPIVKIMFSDAFFEAWRFVPLLVTAYVFHDLAAYIGSIYTAGKKTKMLFISTLIGAVINIVLNVFFIPTVGALGGAVTTLISYFIVWLLRLVKSRKIIELKFNYLSNFISLILLMLQTIFVIMDIHFSYYVIFAILILISLLNCKGVVEIFKMFLKKMTRRKSD